MANGTNLKGDKFLVELRIISNPKTGEDFIVRSDEEIEEQRQLDIRQAHKLCKVKELIGADEAFVANELKNNLAWADANAMQSKDDQKETIEQSVLKTYTLIRPTYGEHLEAEDGATTINSVTFETNFNQQKYINFLFPRSIDGMTPDDVRSLNPLVGRELRSRLMRAIYPSQDRVLFTVSR